MIVAVLITFAIAAIIGGAVLWRLTPAVDRRWGGCCLVATLPMSWLMFFLGSTAWLVHLNGGLRAFGVWLNGYAHCPDCGREYGRSLRAGLNFVLCRYERCSHCGTWHWTRQSRPADSRRREMQK
ncbi:MAG: hypothetical protein MUE94_08015 [Verrucomicrobia bacterium]|jgi:hypothetical protein|nr:hypothetical protein [Verrucomicrobiota bacterium]